MKTPFNCTMDVSMQAGAYHTDKPGEVIRQVDCCCDGQASKTRIDWQHHRDQNGGGKHHYVADEVYPDSQPSIHDLQLHSCSCIFTHLLFIASM